VTGRSRALASQERAAILEVLHSERCVDVAPAQGWATLLDDGIYLGSISTFYRLLRQAGESRERRRRAQPHGQRETRVGRERTQSDVSWDITTPTAAAR
jgi:putative transposase